MLCMEINARLMERESLQEADSVLQSLDSCYLKQRFLDPTPCLFTDGTLSNYMISDVYFPK